MNIIFVCFPIAFEDNNQIIIYSKPQIISPPKFLIKLTNNSFITPLNFNRTETYYLLFSSELICRYSYLNNQTICFYYPILSNFLSIEYHYDEIKHGSLMLSEKSRIHFYIIFIIITIFIIVICFFAIYIICTSRVSLHPLTQLDIIIDTQMARHEAAKRPPDPPIDGAPVQPIVADKEAHTIAGGDM